MLILGYKQTTSRSHDLNITTTKLELEVEEVFRTTSVVSFRHISGIKPKTNLKKPLTLRQYC